MSQRKYVLDVIKDLKLDNTRPVSTPLPKGLSLSTDAIQEISRKAIVS